MVDFRYGPETKASAVPSFGLDSIRGDDVVRFQHNLSYRLRKNKFSFLDSNKKNAKSTK